jgi:hypothetical protein
VGVPREKNAEERNDENKRAACGNRDAQRSLMAGRGVPG